MLDQMLEIRGANEQGAEFQLNQASPNAMAVNRLGSRVVKAVSRVAILRYSFAVSGGNIGTISLKSELGQAWTLPKNAVITGCVIDVISAPTSSGSATIALSTGQAALDLKTSTAYASYTGLVACIPVGVAANDIKITSNVSPTLNIAVASLTGGKFNVLVQYTISD
jgi:hypothetical protein